MHRNTYLLVIILAVIAALLIGINIGKNIFRSSDANSAERAPIAPTPTPLPLSFITYTNAACGFSFDYPNSFTKMDNASGSAVLVSPDGKESITVTCQKDIPREPMPPEKIETKILFNEARSASISAKLYHDTSARDGTPLDVLIFRNPKNGLDIFLAGTGTAFQKIINSLTLL